MAAVGVVGVVAAVADMTSPETEGGLGVRGRERKKENQKCCLDPEGSRVESCFW